MSEGSCKKRSAKTHVAAVEGVKTLGGGREICERGDNLSDLGRVGGLGGDTQDCGGQDGGQGSKPHLSLLEEGGIVKRGREGG